MARTTVPTFESVYAFESLYDAHLLARRGKQGRREVIDFEVNLAENLVELSDALRSQSYTPLPYCRFMVHDPKTRVVHALRYRDRVVQHSLCDNVLAPVIDPRLVFDNAAYRKGKGTHFALDRLSRFMREHWREHGDRGWFLKCDVSKFFASIDHEVLWRKLERLPFDEGTFWLMGEFIDGFSGAPSSGAGGELGVKAVMDEQVVSNAGVFPSARPDPARGLPLGNQSSQWFALLYLDGLDRLVKEQLRVRWYTRYMDDMVLMHQDRGFLQECLARMTEYARDDLRLSFNEKTQIAPLSQGIDYLGFHVYLSPTGSPVRRLRQSAKRRIRRKARAVIAAAKQGRIDPEKAHESLTSYHAHLAHGHTRGFVMTLR